MPAAASPAVQAAPSARTGSYQGAPKTVNVGVAQTLTWTSSELDAAGATDFFVAFQPVGNTTAIVDRVRLRASGRVIMELKLDQLLAYQAKFGAAFRSNLTSGNTLTIPLNLLDASTPSGRDMMQFPIGAEAQLEVVLLATAVAGTAIVAWRLSTATPDFFGTWLTATAAIPASTRNGKYSFSDDGIIRAIIMNTTGVDRAELTISGQRAWNLPGPVFQQLAGVYGDLLTESDFLEDGTNTAGVPTRAHSVDLLLPGAQGSTSLILDTGSTWAGLTNEIAIYALHRQADFHR